MKRNPKFKIRTVAVGLAVLFFTARLVAAAEETNSPPSQEYQGFKIITERNIFNPNRRPGLANTAPKSETPPKIEAFSLDGTWLSAEGNVAFFSGTESSYNKDLKLGETIAGCKIIQIAYDSVQLEMNDSKTDLAVRMQMKRQGEGNWELVLGAAASASSPGSRDRGPAPSGRRGGFSPDGRRGGDPGSFGRRRDRGAGPTGRRDRTSAPGGATNEVAETEPTDEPAAESATESGEDDILKKLMKKREQESNK